MVRFDAGLRLVFKRSAKNVRCEIDFCAVLREAVLMSGKPIKKISVTTEVASSPKSSSIWTSSEGPPSREGNGGRTGGLWPMAWGEIIDEDQGRPIPALNRDVGKRRSGKTKSCSERTWLQKIKPVIVNHKHVRGVFFI